MTDVEVSTKMKQEHVPQYIQGNDNDNDCTTTKINPVTAAATIIIITAAVFTWQSEMKATISHTSFCDWCHYVSQSLITFYRCARGSLPAMAYYLIVINNTSAVTGISPSLWKHRFSSPESQTRLITVDLRLYSLYCLLSSKKCDRPVDETDDLLSKRHDLRIMLSIEKQYYRSLKEFMITPTTKLTLYGLSKASASINYIILLPIYSG